MRPPPAPAGAARLRLASPGLAVELAPAQGADVVSIVERTTGTELLFQAPWHPRGGSHASSREAWTATYPGGWQLLLPNAGDACELDGAELGFHGEAALTAWSVDDAGPAHARLHTRLQTASLLVERTVTVEGMALHVDDRVTNEGVAPARFLWGHHPVFGADLLGDGGRLVLPAERVEADGVDPGGGLAPGAVSGWPHAATATGGTVDLSILPPSAEPRALLAYASGLRIGEARIEAPARGLAVTLRWPLETFPSVWLWQEVHATAGPPWFGRAYAVAVEPQAAHPARGAQALAAAGVELPSLAPGASAGTRVSLHVERLASRSAARPPRPA